MYACNRQSHHETTSRAVTTGTYRVTERKQQDHRRRSQSPTADAGKHQHVLAVSVDVVSLIFGAVVVRSIVTPSEVRSPAACETSEAVVVVVAAAAVVVVSCDSDCKTTYYFCCC
jgi:hypothetical protein